MEKVRGLQHSDTEARKSKLSTVLDHRKDFTQPMTSPNQFVPYKFNVLEAMLYRYDELHLKSHALNNALLGKP